MSSNQSELASQTSSFLSLIFRCLNDSYDSAEKGKFKFNLTHAKVINAKRFTNHFDDTNAFLDERLIVKAVKRLKGITSENRK